MEGTCTSRGVFESSNPGVGLLGDAFEGHAGQPCGHGGEGRLGLSSWKTGLPSSVSSRESGPRRPRLYLIRHGETVWNADGRLLSRTDEPLNAVGEGQAQALADQMADIAWDRAYSSPLRRARRTAEVVLGGRTGAPALSLDDRLVEMDFGPYEGWSDDRLAADPVAATRRRDDAEIPGVESEASVEARARAFLDDLPDLSGTTLVVGHGRMLRILIAAVILGMPPSLSHSMRMRNCRPAIIEPGVRPLLLGFNVGPPADEARNRTMGG